MPSLSPLSSLVLHGFLSAGNIDVLSTEGFVYLQKVKVCYDTVDNEVSALARLTFYENPCSLGKKQVFVVRINRSVLGGLSLGKMYGVSPGTKKAVRKNEVSHIKRVS